MASHSSTNEADDALDIRTVDLRELLVRRNPNASSAQVALTAWLMALIGKTIQVPGKRAPDGDALRLALPSILELAFAESDVSPSGVLGENASPSDGSVDETPRRITLAPRGAAEIRQGSGFGERVGAQEGRRRLEAYASPLSLEDWAGPLAGAAELAERHGIARSTLQDWRRSGAVIGLLKGTRKHVFPLAQFVDGRPLPGLAEVVATIGDARTAWLWLIEPDRDGGSRLDDLKRGKLEAVRATARGDFA